MLLTAVASDSLIERAKKVSTDTSAEGSCQVWMGNTTARNNYGVRVKNSCCVWGSGA